MADRNLIVFFSWGRPELVKRSFESLIKNKRPQDRLLVVDQEGKNLDFYQENITHIDWLNIWKENYGIGPVWMFVNRFLKWKFRLRDIGYTDNRNWEPDFVNIVESDCIGKDGWIGRALKGFGIREKVGIVSGFDSTTQPTQRITDGFKIKKSVCGVNVIAKTEHFIHLSDLQRQTGQDRHASVINGNDKLVVAVIDEITHIG